MQSIQRIYEQVRQNPKLVVSDDFEFAIIERETTTKRYLNGVCEETGKKKQTWLNLRLIQRKAPGIASVSGDTREAVQALIDMASKSSDAAKVDPWFRFPLWRAQAVQGNNELVPLAAEEETFFLRSQFQELAKKPLALAEEHQIEDEKVTLIRKQEKNFLTRSRRNFQTTYNLSIRQDSGWMREERRSGAFKEGYQKEMLAELIGFSVQAASPKVYTGEIPKRLVLGSRVVAFLLKENEERFLARLDKNPTAEEEPLSEVLTLIDDGTLTDLPESGVFDMEGSLMEKTVLAEKGVFKTLLHHAHSATKENRLSTGNFILRARERRPRLGFTNFFIQKGQAINLLQELEEGLFLERVEGLERRADGSLQLWLRGYHVSRGQLVEPLRRIPFHLSIQSLLRSAKSVGQDLEFFGNVGSPSILIENLP